MKVPLYSGFFELKDCGALLGNCIFSSVCSIESKDALLKSELDRCLITEILNHDYFSYMM